MRRRAGLSLLELLVVIAIVGILVALVAVGSRALLDRGRLSESLNAVEAEIGEARRLAKRLDRPVTFQVALQNGTWSTVVDGRTRAVPAGALVSSGAESITFDPPYGTYGGAEVSIDLDVNGISGSVIVTGVLARTLVLR